MSKWQQAFDVISSALGVVAGAANIPGVSLIPYVGTIAAAASAIQGAIKIGQNVTPYIEAIKETFSGDGLPTEEKRLALDARIKELEAMIDAPLPPREEGEPE